MLLLLLSRFSCVDSVRPHRQQPTRLPRPWDSSGKNTGANCLLESNSSSQGFNLKRWTMSVSETASQFSFGLPFYSKFKILFYTFT